MKLFSGFPAGKVHVTPLPNLFFTELLPAIDDLAELKVTLHVIWLVANARAKQSCVRGRDLASDATLMPSLATDSEPAAASLARALERAAQRGTLLRLENAGEAWYFVNSDAGRRAYERAERNAAALPRGDARDAANLQPRADIFALYEQNIGMVTPMLADELKEAEKEYPADWIAEAFQIAVQNNKRSWSYARKILERWKTEGRGDKNKKGKPWFDEYRKFVNR